MNNTEIKLEVIKLMLEASAQGRSVEQIIEEVGKLFEYVRGGEWK